MVWNAPEVTRCEEPTVGPERPMLEGLLDWNRDTLLHKCVGLTGEQLALRAAPPSTLSLVGLVRHMADVERSWFRRRLHVATIPTIFQREDTPDADFTGATPAGAEEDLAILRRECADSRAAAVDVALDYEFLHPRTGESLSLRWVYLHMIDEYARHNGHADILRQRIDGMTGI